MNKDNTKEYLGDSVYVRYTSHSIVLTTENGIPEDPSNEIFLEPEVLLNLIRYTERIGLYHPEGAKHEKS